MGTINKAKICFGGNFQKDIRGELMDNDLSLEEIREAQENKSE